MSPGKSLFGKKNSLQTIRDYPLPPSCSVSNLTEFLADGNASFLRAARSGNLEKVIEFLKGSIDINTSNANGLNALHLAAKEGHVNVVTELLKRGANVNAATKKGNTALHIASLAGQEEVVKVLIQLGANVNVQSQNGFTPLYMAAQENHDNVVSFLLASGANQSLATEDGFTPLAVALQQGHDKVVAVLLENDTKGKVRLPALHIAAKKDDCKAATLLLQSDHNPDVTSKSGFTPLHIAAHYGNENIAKILLSKGADVNFAAKHQITPLHVASKWGKLNMVVLLLEKGAHIDASTRDGLTPLHCAARSGHDMVVDLLLEKGAPFLAKTKNGLAPLHMASQGDHVDSARILLFHKAPVDDVTVDYLTALHVAAHCGHVKVAKLLLDRKADANARALNGFTPLHIACKKNRIKVVELLLKHGASIEATTESGLTPLHVASFMGCMNIVIYLIQNGANPDVPTVRGETPLHLAARANQTDIIRILLRNGASVDARAREEQTPLHIAARLGNVDIVSLLLQHGAAVDAVTKDMYTALHITAKEDQEEVAAALLDHGASLTATTKKGFTPLHLAAKYGNIKVARLLLQKGAPVDAQGKNGVTPLHVAAHYDHVNVALLLLDKGASPHAMAKNGYTPLHIAAKKNQMDIASTLLEYGANTNSESKAGFTPLHLASQEGHADMSSLLIENKANVNQKANNGLTPLHLCAQDDRVNVAQVLVRNGAEICPQTKAGYTPLHVACHFGQINMVRFLLQNDANVHTVTSHGYTPLHQAAQQGHTLVVNLLLENQASPNVTTVQGQTPLSIAQRLGYISVVETLKVVTETTVTTTTTTVTEEKYKVVAPETMQETFMTDSEDEGGEEAMLGDQSYRYLTADEMKSLGDDSLPIDVTKDEKQQDAMQAVKQFGAPMVEEDNLSPQHGTPVESGFSEKFSPDNVDLAKAPVHAGFLVSFMVDARGGAMRGCRHSGVRVIIPPRKASMPMRITCRYLRKEKLIHPPPLMEGEACASRILEMGPVGARFLGPVIIEVPHFASTRGKEREITILRSDTGESWREHTLEASEEAVQEVLNESFEGEELSALEDLNTNRITRILTTDFPQYFAIVTRIRQEVHGVGPEGGMVSSTVVPQVQAIFPEGALTKKIRVGLQAQPIAPELVAKLLGNRVAVSPIVTVEPRRRKFHKPITLTIPVPQAATKGMINQYSGDAPTLRLLCSITGSTKSGGSSKAQWEDVTGSTPLTFVNDCVSFTTTVSARFWLMDCRQVNEVTRFATELYQEAVYVPFMSKFVIFAKRHDPFEAQLRVFCMTDDKEDKTLESQEHFTEVAKSRDVEVLEGKLQYLEFAGNLVPVTKSGEQLKLDFQAFHENRLPFTIRVKDPHVEAMGRIAFMKEPKAGRGEPPQTPICNLNVALPEVTMTEANADVLELVTLEKSYDFIQESGLSKPELIHRADLRLSDIARELDKDWVLLAQQLDIPEQDTEQIKAQTVCEPSEQARMMLRLWLQKSGPKATGNELEKGLRKINREDIINKCMFNVELVTDDVEKAVAKVHLDQSGFDVFKEELGSSREASMRRGASLDVSYDEQDIMKEAESAAETSSETGSLFERDQLPQALSDEKDAKMRRASKTPPPSPIDESVDKGGIGLEKLKEISALLPEIKDSESKKPTETELKTVEVIGVQEIPAKLTESETWPSGDLDTSQVSVSSLPDDEKSEPTTATVSSTAAVTIDAIKKVMPDSEPDEDFEEETLSPTKFKEDLCSKKASPTKSIFESKMFLSPKVVQLTPEKILCLQELPLSPVKEDSEIETKEMCTSPCTDKLETVKPNQLISTRKGFRTRKRLSPIHDGTKIEQKLPSRVDKGLSPIAVLTAGPSGVEQEGSEYFVQTYDAPSMEEPTPSTLKFCSKSTEMSPKSIFEKNVSKTSVAKIVSEEDLTSSIVNETIKESSVCSELTDISKIDVSCLVESKESIVVVKVEDVKSEIVTCEKVEKSTSPFSDIMLDTGIGTDATVTADTASSPFFPDTLSPSSLSFQSSAPLMKENSSTQTIQVEMLSAHTSPIDGPFSLQESNISCCGTESSLKSDSLDDISRTLGTPSSDNVDVGLELNYSLPQNFSKDITRSTVKEFLEEHTVSDSASDVVETEDVSTSSSHEIYRSDPEDKDAIDKMLVIESFRNVFATQPPFSVVASQQRASPKRHAEYGKKRRSLVLSEASSEDKIFSLHDQLLSEESALESSTDSGVDLKESTHAFTASVQGTVQLSSESDLKNFAESSEKDIYGLGKEKRNILSSDDHVYKVDKPSICDKTPNLYFEDNKEISKITMLEETAPTLEVTQFPKKDFEMSQNILNSEKDSYTKKEVIDIVPDYLKRVEDEVLSASASDLSVSPVKEIDTFHMQEIFHSSVEREDKVEEILHSKVSEREDKSMKPVEEEAIKFTKASLSFDSEEKGKRKIHDSQSPSETDYVASGVSIVSSIEEEISPILEFQAVYMQEVFEPVVEKKIVGHRKDIVSKPFEESPVVSLERSPSSDSKVKTSAEKEIDSLGESTVRKDDESDSFIAKVEEEILQAQTFSVSLSPVADVSAIYAQEILESSVLTDISSSAIEPGETDMDIKCVTEEPVVFAKVSMLFHQDSSQVQEAKLPSAETDGELIASKESEESHATYISEKETFSNAVDKIFRSVEIDSEATKKRFIENQVFVSEATVIKDKRDSLYLSDPKKLSPKLEQSTSTDTTVEEFTELDKSGTPMHIIQKTTHMTLITQTKCDGSMEDSSSKPISGIDMKDEQVVAETVTKSLESPSSDLDAALKSPESISVALESVKEKEPTEHVQQLSSENLIYETDASAVEDSLKSVDISLPQREDRLASETQYIEKSESSFVPCAFINTAFAGADAIDEVEQVSPIRARSPYEVVRGEPDSISDDIPVEERDIPSAIERVSYVTRHVEIKRRPILQHIPSEISEEDLVEREITSPVSKDDAESFDVSTRVERKLSEEETSDIKVVRTITTTKVIQSSGGYEDGAEEISKPLEISQELQSTGVPDDDASGMKVVKTVTTTRVIERSGDYNEKAELIHGLPPGSETGLLEGELSSKITTSVTTTKVIQSIDDTSDKGMKPEDIFEKSLGVKEVIETSEIPADIETEIFENESSGTKIVKKIVTTTRIVSSSGDFDDSTDKTSLDIKEGMTARDKSVASGDDLSSLTIVKTVKTSQVISCPENLDYLRTVASKEVGIVKEISPKLDTGIPTSPFEIISESELINANIESSTLPASQSYPVSQKDDSVTTTEAQSITQKTISVSVASPEDQRDSCSKWPEPGETQISSQQAVHTVDTVLDSKPLTNGPGEVEYQAEYDYYDEKYGTEDISYAGGHSGIAEDPKKCHYSTVSDDVIDSEIKDILDSDQQSDDIIERPVTPEPPGDDGSDFRFMREGLKHPSEEGLIRETDFAYTDDDAVSPSSDSKSGFAYGMEFEKYALDQAEEAMDVDSDQYSEEKEPSFSYGMRFERDPDLDEEDIPCYGDLYTHEEEDEDALENGEKLKIVPKPVKDSDFDILAGRKYFTKNVELDELSMSSLQEFERLEAEIVSGRKSSIGSMDSLNGKQAVSKSGEHDDVSMSSLTEFERIERECTEVEKIDPSMQESITQLSEIEEGHESQASETSQENKSDAGKDEDVSILEDYNNELENIEEIILQTDSKKTEELPFQFMLKQSQKTELIGDSTELIYKEDKFADASKQRNVRSNISTEVTKISSWATSKSLESSSLGDAKDDLDQDSLRDELSLKPDSLIDDGKHDFQDSLREERFDDADSLQEENLDEMRDSLFEERHIEDDSLHEMDILPDESSLSLEGSLPAVASLDSSKADDPVKEKVICIQDSQQELDHRDVFQMQGKTQINVRDLTKGVDVMQSSTDSLEQSSSAALAAFHVESESLMSSSLNSAMTSEDYTMVSSTDTLEHEGRITYRYEDIPVDDIELLVRGGHKVIVDSEGNIQAHYDSKAFISTEEVSNFGLSKHVTQPPTTEVEVHPALTTVKYVNGDKKLEKSNVFSSSDQGKDYTSFESSHFDPDVEVEEFETTDEFGKTKVIRRIKKVTRSKAQFSSSSSSKDVEEKLKEFLKEHTAGEDAGSAKEEVEEERTVDDKGNVIIIRTVKQQVLTEPEVHSRTFTGPNADQRSQEYVETFQTLNPTEDVSEYEKIDEQGNVVRVTQKFVVTPQVHTVSFSGPDAHKQMEDYMKQWTLQSQNVGEFEGDQQRTVLPALQMSRSSEQSDASIPTDASENLVHKVTGGTVVTKTVVSTFSTDLPEKLTQPESSTSSSPLLESEKAKTSDLTTDASSMPK